MKNRKMAARIRKYLKRTRGHREFGAPAPDRALLDGTDCELCYDAAWWAANGFTEAERYAICGPDGLNCPNMPPPTDA